MSINIVSRHATFNKERHKTVHNFKITSLTFQIYRPAKGMVGFLSRSCQRRLVAPNPRINSV